MRVRRNPIAGQNLFTTYRDMCGNTSLHSVVEQRDYGKVKFYAEFPQLINSANNCGDSPLHYCAFNDFPAAANVLLGNGADINAVNVLKQTPVMLAVLNKAYQTLEFLLTVRTVIVDKKVNRKETIHKEINIKLDPFLTGYRELTFVHYALLMNDERIKHIVLRALAKWKIFFVQSSEPNWFNPNFITLYTKSSHHSKMLNECKGGFKWGD